MNPTPPFTAPMHPGAPRGAGALIAFALHAAVLAALLSIEPTRATLIAAAPIMVDLLAPPVPQPKLEKPTAPPKPRAVARAPRRTAEPQPILAAAADVPTPVVAPERTLPTATPVPARAVPATPAPIAPPAPALPLTQPIFNADYLANPAPAYPSLSRRAGEQGRVVLRVLVSPQGRSTEVEVRTTSGSARLDEAARLGVLRWKFVPARRGEEAVAAWVLIPISFKLEG